MERGGNNIDDYKLQWRPPSNPLGYRRNTRVDPRGGVGERRRKVHHTYVTTAIDLLLTCWCFLGIPEAVSDIHVSILFGKKLTIKLIFFVVWQLSVEWSCGMSLSPCRVRMRNPSSSFGSNFCFSVVKLGLKFNEKGSERSNHPYSRSKAMACAGYRKSKLQNDVGNIFNEYIIQKSGLSSITYSQTRPNLGHLSYWCNCTSSAYSWVFFSFWLFQLLS